jgi:hypothetical protein
MQAGNRVCKKTWPRTFGYNPDGDSTKCGRYAPHPPVNFFRDVSMKWILNGSSTK